MNKQTLFAKYLLFIGVLFCIGCSEQNSNFKISEKEKIVNEVQEKASIQLKRKNKLHTIGTGAQMMDEVKMLALSFIYYKEVKISEGRELLITAMNEFVQEINTDKRILPHLKPCPFEPKNVEIRIFLKNRDGSSFSLGKICVISAIDGVLSYDIKDPQTKRLKTIYEETYEEAVEKLHQQPI